MAISPAPRAPRPVRRLRPLLRHELPRALHADRAWAYARTLSLGVRDPAFRALVQQIDGSPWHGLGEIDVFEDGAETFDAIIAAIDASVSDVLLETYILRDDRIGERMRRAMTHAVERGVQVRVLADALGSHGTSRAYWRALEAAGISVRLFHPWWHSPLHAWRRDHRKIIVVDRAIAFAGGMNIGEEYGSTGRPLHTAFRDSFARVTGAVVPELASVFAEGWQRAGGEPIPGVLPVTRTISRDTLPEEQPGVLILDGRPGRGQPESISVLASLVGAARERLWITTPYFAPPDGGLYILIDAAQRGVDVRLLLPGRTDVPLLRHAAHGAYARLLRGGVRIFEYAPCILHAKTMVCDGHLAVIGSANLDFRSLWFNAECNLLLSDDATARAMEQHFEADLAESTEIVLATWQARGMWHRVGDAMARSLRVLL